MSICEVKFLCLSRAWITIDCPYKNWWQSSKFWSIDHVCWLQEPTETPENGQAAEAAEAPGPVFFPLPHSQALHGGNLAKFQVRLHSFIHFHLFPSVAICFHPDPFRLFPSVSEFPSPFTYGFGCGKRKIHPVLALTLNRPLSQEAHEPQEVGGDGRVLVSTVLPDFSICMYMIPREWWVSPDGRYFCTCHVLYILTLFYIAVSGCNIPKFRGMCRFTPTGAGFVKDDWPFTCFINAK